jgi:ribulose-phosphate 3-epimerase
MSVEPGFGGQKFMPEVLNKTEKVKEIIDKRNLNTEIEIDGGINFNNCIEAKRAGATVLVSGSTIFKENQGNLKKNIEILRTN